MTIFMRLLSLILIVAALVFLGADAVSSLERGGELTDRVGVAADIAVRQCQCEAVLNIVGLSNHDFRQ